MNQAYFAPTIPENDGKFYVLLLNADEGYYEVRPKPYNVYDDAKVEADKLNEKLGLTTAEVRKIILGSIASAVQERYEAAKFLLVKSTSAKLPVCRCDVSNIAKCTNGCVLYVCCGGYFTEGHMTDCDAPADEVTWGTNFEPDFHGPN